MCDVPAESQQLQEQTNGNQHLFEEVPKKPAAAENHLIVVLSPAACGVGCIRVALIDAAGLAAVTLVCGQPHTEVASSHGTGTRVSTPTKQPILYVIPSVEVQHA
jgi:hypothetical protein